MIGQQKNNRTLYHQNQDLIEKSKSIFKIQKHIRIILKFFEKYKCSGIAFFLQSPRYVSNEQSCLKTTGLYDDLLLLKIQFHFFYFIFSTPISFILFSNVSISFFQVLSQAFIKHSRKTFVYIYINNMYNIYQKNYEFLPN